MTIRSVLTAALLLGPSAIAFAAAPEAIPAPVAGVRGVAGVAVTVEDLNAATAWYTTVLDFVAEGDAVALHGPGFERVTGVFGAGGRGQRLRLGEEAIELLAFDTPRGRPFPADSRANDRWFQHIAVIVRDMDEAVHRLSAAGVRPASAGPQRLPDSNPKAGGIRAFYFRDPDGHYLEVLEFPPGKGEARWQSNERLFLGIDHTAIVVADTDASLAFYRDTLGLSVAGESENFGAEQERLNAVFPAHLRITTLRAASGPGVELLEYLTPGDGRAAPLDTTPADLWHWHVVLLADEPAAAFAAVRRAGGRAVSPEVNAVAWPFFPSPAASLLVRDADGHGVLLVDP